MKKVLFIGLSDKQGVVPLDSNTKSGAIVDMIISKINAESCKTNLVNFVPLDENGKIRYPNKIEMDKGFINLKNIISTINPDVCVCLGSKVSEYLSDKIDNIVSIKHPSYIYVYKRKYTDDYVNDAVKLINNKIN